MGGPSATRQRGLRPAFGPRPWGKGCHIFSLGLYIHDHPLYCHSAIWWSLGKSQCWKKPHKNCKKPKATLFTSLSKNVKSVKNVLNFFFFFFFFCSAGIHKTFNLQVEGREDQERCSKVSHPKRKGKLQATCRSKHRALWSMPTLLAPVQASHLPLPKLSSSTREKHLQFLKLVQEHMVHDACSSLT